MKTSIDFINETNEIENKKEKIGIELTSVILEHCKNTELKNLLISDTPYENLKFGEIEKAGLLNWWSNHWKIQLLKRIEKKLKLLDIK